MIDTVPQGLLAEARQLHAEGRLLPAACVARSAIETRLRAIHAAYRPLTPRCSPRPPLHFLVKVLLAAGIIDRPTKQRLTRSLKRAHRAAHGNPISAAAVEHVLDLAGDLLSITTPTQEPQS